MAKCRPNKSLCGMKDGLFNPFFTGNYANPYSYSGGDTPAFPDCESGVYDVHAQLLITELEDAGATLSDTRKGYINDLFLSLKAGNDNFSKIPLLQIYASPTDASALFNWPNPYAFIPTKTGTLTFTADKGYTGNGSTGFINSNFKDDLSHIPLQNSVAMFVWNLSNTAETATICGVNPSGTGSSQSLLQPKRADTSKAAADLYSASPANQTTNTISDPRGLWVLRRTVSGLFEIWLNGVLLETFTATSVAQATKVFYYVLAQNNNGTAAGFSARQVAAFGVSSGDIDVPELYTSISTYFTQIGV